LTEAIKCLKIEVNEWNIWTASLKSPEIIIGEEEETLLDRRRNSDQINGAGTGSSNA
jgi:hypothetical protein